MITPPDTEKQNVAVTLPPSVAEALDGYRIVRQIHEDASCVVYKAEERESQKAVIVRVGYREVFGHADNLAHSSDLARKLMSIRHPALAPLLKVEATPDGHWVFVSEAMRGVPLPECAQGLGLSRRSRLKLFIEVCKAVHGLHQHCFAHRDLRPSKILVDGKSNPRLTDFAVATLTDFDNRFSVNEAQSKGLEHLLLYRSPEQQRGEADQVDTRTDIHALGAILFEFLTGSLPQSPVSGGELALPKELAAIVRKAMAPDPADRYASALVMAEDIHDYLRVRPVRAYSRGRLYAFARLLARRPISIGAAVLAVVFACALGVAKHRMAMFDAAKQRHDLTVKLTSETSRLQAAFDDARADARRYREEFEEAEAKLAGLESQVAGLQGDLTSAVEARDALRRQQALNDSRPDQSRDFAAMLVDVIAGSGDALPADPKEATAYLLRRAAEVGEARLADRPSMKTALFEGLVGAYRGLGCLGEAARLQEKVVASKRASLGDADRGTLDSASELAMLLYNDGRFTEAEALCQDLLKSSRRAFGDRHERTATAANNLAMTLGAQGKFGEAEPLFREALEARVQLSGRDDLKTACTMYELGGVLFELGKITESETILRESLAVFEEKLPAAHWQLAMAEKRFAAALLAMGRFDEAEKRLLSSYHRFESGFGPDHAQTREVASQIAKLYTSWGKDEKAGQWNARTSPSPAEGN